MSPRIVRIGYVPEHYLLPLHLAKPYLEHDGIQTELVPFPSGTGHMITSLRSDEIDLAIGLTEGWVAGLLSAASKQAGGYKLVGSWCQNPLRWSIVTGQHREGINNVSDLARHRKVGVSRMGSGSHIIATVLAQQEKWLDPKEPGAAQEAMEFVPCGPFADLREAVNSGKADFFMWEHFTTKPWFEDGSSKKDLKWIGEIYSPWPSWFVTASDRTFPHPDGDETLDKIFQAFDAGVKDFEADDQRVIKMLGDGSANCHYSEEDAAGWLKSVKFFSSMKGVDPNVIKEVVNVLKVAGVIDEETASSQSAIRSAIGIAR